MPHLFSFDSCYYHSPALGPLVFLGENLGTPLGACQGDCGKFHSIRMRRECTLYHRPDSYGTTLLFSLHVETRTWIVPVDCDATGEAVFIPLGWSRVVRWTVVFSLEKTFASKLLFVWVVRRLPLNGLFRFLNAKWGDFSFVRFFHSTVTRSKERA